MSLVTRLYRGEVTYDFIGPRKRWYIDQRRSSS